MPAVDCQGQCATHPDIVERLSLVVRRDQGAAIPVALLNGDLVTQCGDKFVAGGRGKPAEFDRRTVTFDRCYPDRLLVGENAGEAVEIGNPWW